MGRLEKALVRIRWMFLDTRQQSLGRRFAKEYRDRGCALAMLPACNFQSRYLARIWVAILGMMAVHNLSYGQDGPEQGLVECNPVNGVLHLEEGSSCKAITDFVLAELRMDDYSTIELDASIQEWRFEVTSAYFGANIRIVGSGSDGGNPEYDYPERDDESNYRASSGGDCVRGSDGGDGSQGDNGQNGRTINARIGVVNTGGSISIALDGGAGGAGGRGQAGGHGGKADCSDDCRGKNGGKGGDGGNGGNGGQGGDLNLTYRYLGEGIDSFVEHLEVSNSGGSGGLAGQSGEGGRRGPGKSCGLHRKGGGSSGDSGNAGESGKKGDAGRIVIRETI